MSEGHTQNPPPEKLVTQVFVIREVIALCFVGVWLLLYVGELVTGAYYLPFWFHCVAVGVLAYALGVSVATLTSFRDPGGGHDRSKLRRGHPEAGSDAAPS